MLEGIGKIITDPIGAVSSVIFGGLSGMAGTSEGRGGTASSDYGAAVRKASQDELKFKKIAAAEHRGSQGFLKPPPKKELKVSNLGAEVLQIFEYIESTDTKKALIQQLERQGHHDIAMYIRDKSGVEGTDPTGAGRLTLTG